VHGEALLKLVTLLFDFSLANEMQYTHICVIFIVLQVINPTINLALILKFWTTLQCIFIAAVLNNRGSKKIKMVKNKTWRFTASKQKI
jgi:hypothetical protein